MSPEERKPNDVTAESQGDNTHLSAGDLEHFRDLLIAKRRQLLRDKDEMARQGLRPSFESDQSGDVTSVPTHLADEGTDAYEQRMELGAMGTERHLIYEVDEAMRKMEEGTYGVCEGGGEPISKERLDAKPWARYCIRHADAFEGGEAPQRGPAAFE